jgi:hypothetical protein
VHEKTILVAAIPAVLSLSFGPSSPLQQRLMVPWFLSIATFSMLPLLHKVSSLHNRYTVPYYNVTLVPIFTSQFFKWAKQISVNIVTGKSINLSKFSCIFFAKQSFLHW